MMNLTAAQETVYYTLMTYIESARKCETFEEYFIKHYSKYVPKSYNTPDAYKAWNKGGYNDKQREWEVEAFTDGTYQLYINGDNEGIDFKSVKECRDYVKRLAESTADML